MVTDEIHATMEVSSGRRADHDDGFGKAHVALVVSTFKFLSSRMSGIASFRCEAVTDAGLRIQ